MLSSLSLNIYSYCIVHSLPTTLEREFDSSMSLIVVGSLLHNERAPLIQSKVDRSKLNEIFDLMKLVVCWTGTFRFSAIISDSRL